MPKQPSNPPESNSEASLKMASFIEKFVFFALIFSIPFQKRFFLFGPSAEGDRFFEWSSGFLYFTDILIIFLFVLWAGGMVRRLSSSWSLAELSILSSALLLFLGFGFISLTQAEFVDVGVYRFIKLAEFIVLFFYVASRSRRFGIRAIMGAFVASGVFQAILAVLQFAKQSSLGLEIFHESTLTLGMKGVAQISPQGLDMIRAYGTFPSPNVLAGFLGICLLLAFCLWLRDLTERQCYPLAHSRQPSGWLRGSRLRQGYGGHSGLRPCLPCRSPQGEGGPKQPSNPPESNTASPRAGPMYSVAIFLLTFGLILTFSRGVIVFFVFTSVLFFAGIFLLEKLKQYRRQAVRLLLLFVTCFLICVVLLWPEVSARVLESSTGEPAIQERLFFNKVGADTVSQNYAQLFFGVGIGNFVQHYMQSLPGLAPHLYQPVHNIFILIASEIGIFGLIAFVGFLALLLKKSLQQFFSQPFVSDRERMAVLLSLLCVMCFALLIGTYDHYFWTLQQGSLMFWISLGLLFGSAAVYNEKL